jgi:pSer/pThr/pTyr-binding forkhead associated (FHA) protein
MLTVCDDGKTEGAVIRIFSHRFIIGRTEGDLRIEIDGRISSRHAEITLQTVAGRHHRWVLTDLQSTHGVFVRVTRALLTDKSEFLVGGGRYRFDAPRIDQGASTEALPAEESLGETSAWQDDATTIQPPALTELVGNEIGNRIVMDKPEYWIGSDPACPIARPNDPFCEPRHVRVYRDSKGAWHAENNKTQNGLWIRMSQVAVDAMIQFQIGEQRFRLRVR